MPHLQPALGAILVVAGCAGLSALLILVLRPILVRHLLAHPNARSSHKIATPQGAGLAVMGSVLAGSALGTIFWVQQAEPSLLPILATAVGLTILGALDDAHALPVSWRLIGQMLAALVLVFSLPEGLRVLPGLLPLAVERALIALGAVWFINAINFLDGLDWMTVAQVVPMTLGIVVLQAFGLVPASVGLLALALLGATLGFAVFNKHPAQIFLGDAGSLPIGFCLAFMLIFVARENLAAALLLSLYTLADATLTLLRRLAEGEPVYTAHRTHFYQRAVTGGLSVPQVTMRIFLLGVVLAVLAVGAALAGSIGVDLLLLGLGVAVTWFTLWRMTRGTE
jgi:UDP-N-acetylmuramyl pentapeptide phosphotransferase/UDP-N-acetylglucosamine-1-phosphate transferase